VADHGKKEEDSSCSKGAKARGKQKHNQVRDHCSRLPGMAPEPAGRVAKNSIQKYEGPAHPKVRTSLRV